LLPAIFRNARAHVCVSLGQPCCVRAFFKSRAVFAFANCDLDELMTKSFLMFSGIAEVDIKTKFTLCIAILLMKAHMTIYYYDYILAG